MNRHNPSASPRPVPEPSRPSAEPKERILSAPRRLFLVGGLLYLLIIACGVTAEAILRAPLLSKNADHLDAGQTVVNLLAAEGVFRMSILADAVMVLADVALGVVLFGILKSVNPTVAMAATAFRLAQAAVLGANLIQLQQAISLAHNAQLEPSTRNALVAQSLNAHAVGYDLGLLFFAVHCVLLGYLLTLSQQFRRVVGWGMIAAGLVYSVGSTLRVVAPELSSGLAPGYAIALLSELTLCGALCMKGRLRTTRLVGISRASSTP